MSYRVRVLRRAQSDLAEIARYVAVDAPEAAGRLLDSLLEATEGPAEFPARGAVPRDDRLRRQGFRFLVEGQYLTFYKVLRTEVRVYRVVHGKRAYERWL